MYAAVRFPKVDGRILMVIVDQLDAEGYETLRNSLRGATGIEPSTAVSIAK